MKKDIRNRLARLESETGTDTYPIDIDGVIVMVPIAELRRLLDESAEVAGSFRPDESNEQDSG